MWNPLVLKLWAIVQAVIAWAESLVVSALRTLVKWGLDILVQVWDWVVSKLPPEFVQWVTDFDWTVPAQYIADAAWIFPFVPILGILAVRYTITAIILVVRWIIHVFPTVGG